MFDFLSALLTSDFNIPVGATADLKELEYISALHQSGDVFRRNGSISSDDIVQYLISRHGIRFSPQYVKDSIIVAQFGGGDQNKLIDLVELTSVLIIPILIKMRKAVVLSEGEKGDTSNDLYKERWATVLDNSSEVIGDVWKMIIADSSIVTSGGEDLTLTENTIKKILISYDMKESANDDQLVQNMLHLILSSSQPEESTDDHQIKASAFAKALTADIKMFETKNYEVDESISKSLFAHTFGDLENEDQEDNFDLDQQATATHTDVFTTGPIDFTADIYRSKGFVICLWVCFLLFYYSYLFNFSDIFTYKCSNNTPGCRILRSVVFWLEVAAFLMLSGLIFIGMGSVGFARHSKSFIRSFLGICSIVALTILTFFFSVEWGINTTGAANDLTQNITSYMVVCLGCFIILQQLLHLLSTRYEGILRCTAFTPSSVIAEASIKDAAVFKLARMTKNAHEVHKICVTEREEGSNETFYGRALLQFFKQAQNSKQYSVVQIWTQIFNRTLFNEEGVWLSSRLLVGVFAQLIAVFLFLTTVLVFIRTIMEIDKPDISICTTLPTCDLHECTSNCTVGVDLVFKPICRLGCLKECQPCQSLFPTWSYRVASVIGLSITAAIVLVMISNYIPSYVTSTLKFRTGVFQSLEDPFFEDYRIQAAFTSNLTGAMFWGILYTGITMSLFFCFVIFFFIAPILRDVVYSILTTIAGFAITVMIRMCAMILFRTKCFAAFYRKHPGLSNIVGLAFECWNIALALGFLFARSVKLILTAAFYMGRVDKPLLNVRTRIQPLNVDYYPMVFKADILSHDAHRHPYIETLGVIYLLKLRYKLFASPAGSTWRLLFVMALFPWLRKHRLNNRSKSRSSLESDQHRKSADFVEGSDPVENMESSEVTFTSCLSDSDIRAKVMTENDIDVLRSTILSFLDQKLVTKNE